MQANHIGRVIIPTKPTFLDILPLDEKRVMSPSLSPGESLPEVRDDTIDHTIENDTKADLYVVEPLSANESPDKLRTTLEEALDTLSYHFREFPTLPADDKHKSKPLPAAYAEDVAIVLPRKHCAFIGCAWCGDDEKSQAMHIVDDHTDLLHEGMEAYKQYKTMTYDSDAVLALSVYNESLAIAIRRGAPLASYSIDRKCLQAYAKRLTHSDTATLLCFSCALKFPCVYGAKGNPIQRYNIRNPQKQTIAMTMFSFFGMSKEEALDISGLARFCQKYGTVSDDAISKEDDDEIQDWHLQVQFGSDTFKL